MTDATRVTDVTRTIGTYPTYDQARVAADRIIDGDVPPESVTIFARGIRLVERLHPRGWLSAAADGAASGAMIGLLVGFFLGLFNLNAPGFGAFVLGFWGALFGSVAGLVTSLVIHAFRRDSQRAASERSLDADEFDLHVDREHAGRARRIITDVGTNAAQSAAA